MKKRKVIASSNRKIGTPIFQVLTLITYHKVFEPTGLSFYLFIGLVGMTIIAFVMSIVQDYTTVEVDIFENRQVIETAETTTTIVKNVETED